MAEGSVSASGTSNRTETPAATGLGSTWQPLFRRTRYCRARASGGGAGSLGRIDSDDPKSSSSVLPSEPALSAAMIGLTARRHGLSQQESSSGQTLSLSGQTPYLEGNGELARALASGQRS